MVQTTTNPKGGHPFKEGAHEAAFQSRSWLNFTRALHSKATRIGYTHDLRKYMEFLGADDPDKLLVGNQMLLEDQILGYIEKRKSDGASSDSMRRACAGIKKFYDENRVALTWAFILNKIARTKRKKKDKAYTRAMIAKLRNIADIRENPVLSLCYSCSRVSSLFSEYQDLPHTKRSLMQCWFTHVRSSRNKLGRYSIEVL